MLVVDLTLTMRVEATLKARCRDPLRRGRSVTALAQSEATEPRWRWPRAAYVHIPFCAHKCGYCDFASLAGVDHLADRYLPALEREIETFLVEPQEVDTIFVGGGTPTRLDAAQLASALRDHQASGSFSRPAASGRSRRIPGRSTPKRPTSWPRRASTGSAWARSRSSRDCSQCSSASTAAPRSSRRSRSSVRGFARWSLDLIFGVPGSTPEQWRDDLETALSLGPSHLSCYGLVFEKGTPLWSQQAERPGAAGQRGARAPMYETTIERLAEAGLAMYEISNFARPGQESRHNLVYWANDAYFGFGVGAARYLRGVRSTNTRDLAAYLRAGRSRARARPARTKSSAPEERARETAMLMLRRTEAGIERDDFQLRTGFDLDLLCRQRDRAIHGAGLPGRRWAAGEADAARHLRGRPRLLRAALDSRRVRSIDQARRS